MSRGSRLGSPVRLARHKILPEYFLLLHLLLHLRIVEVSLRCLDLPVQNNVGKALFVAVFQVIFTIFLLLILLENIVNGLGWRVCLPQRVIVVGLADQVSQGAEPGDDLFFLHVDHLELTLYGREVV